MLLYRIVLILGLFLSQALHAANLQPHTALYPGQSLFSDNGRYQLAMQGDGNLVYYRRPEMSVRWNSQTQGNPGAWTQMQADGNLVTYSAGVVPLWSSQSPGRPGAYLAAQDDGNLVIYHNGAAVWHIGADSVEDSPTMIGDVVGRDLASSPADALGHLGFWDGQNVVEVLNQPQVVQYSSLASFKAGGGYWGAASPNIPLYYVYGCYLDYCSSSGYETVASRVGMFYRAYQIAILGADYTLTTYVRRAAPRLAAAGGNVPYVKGLYRCDTFVLDVYASNGGVTADGSSQAFNALQQNWFQFEAGPLRTPIIPSSIFSKLKAFRG